jgi:tRNA A-37 threonylcarbamoyl transferase component Bud32
MITSRVIPDDAVLPQLSLVLDAQAMQRVFDQHLKTSLGQNKIKVLRCEIERVKYRPKRNCIIGYKFSIADSEGEHEQRLCVGIYTPDEAQARHEKALREANIAVANFAPVALISSLNMVVWAFPNERKLTALPLLIDAKQLCEKILPEMVHERWGEEWRILNIINNISNYFPEHTCCVSVSLNLQHAISGALRSWEIIGKTRYDDTGAEAFRHMATLWDPENPYVSYARPLAYQCEHRLLWQERVPGVTLSSLLASGDADHALLTRVARAVAALHGTPIISSRHITQNSLINKLIAAKQTISTARADCAGVLQQVAYSLTNSARHLGSYQDGTLHGDLHSNNILVSPTQIHLIDMDGISSGPPLADLGSFLAELIYRGCLKGEPLEAMRPLLATVVEAYRQRATWPVADANVAWFTASALIHERALRCVTSLKPGRMETVDNVIDAARRIAAGFRFTHFVSTVGCEIKHSERAA